MTRVVWFFVIVVVMLTGSVGLAGPGYAQPEKIDARLWTATANGQPASFLVVLAEQADLNAAKGLADPAGRRQWVYDALRQAALRSQKPLRAWLDWQDVPYTTHYLVNMLAVEGDRTLLLALARRSDVASLLPNPLVRGVDPAIDAGSRPEAATLARRCGRPTACAARESWSVCRIRASSGIIPRCSPAIAAGMAARWSTRSTGTARWARRRAVPTRPSLATPTATAPT